MRRRTFNSIIITAGLALISLSAFAAPIKVACVGDSITAGYGASNRATQSYPAQLQGILGDKYVVKNCGTSGIMMKNCLPKWAGAIKAFQPDVVTIMLGTNDTKSRNVSDPGNKAKFDADYKAASLGLLKFLNGLESKPKIYICYPVPVFKSLGRINEKSIVEDILPALTALAKEQSLPVIDLYKTLEGKGALVPDGVHPNAVAYTIIAKVIAEAISSPAANSAKELVTPGLPAAYGNWHGFKSYKFTNAGAKCKVIAPKKAAPGKPWIWRARFFGHEPQADIALLNHGFHLTYCDVANLLGAPQAVKRWDDFYDFATTTMGLSKKVALEGMSRGGLIIFNWAKANPDKVSCIYGDAPVCDFKSWPGGKGKSKGAGSVWQQCIAAYAFKSEAEALAYKENPIDNAAAIAKAKIPVMIVYGKADATVPDVENCLIFEKNFKEAGGDIIMIGKDKCGHHPHSLKDPKQIVDFVLKNSGMSDLVE